MRDTNCILAYGRTPFAPESTPNHPLVNLDRPTIATDWGRTHWTEQQVECRRVLILEFFGEHFPRERCRGTCDNCIAMQGCAKETKDCTEQVTMKGTYLTGGFSCEFVGGCRCL